MFLPYKKIIVLFGLAGLSLLGILAAKPLQADKPEIQKPESAFKKHQR